VDDRLQRPAALGAGLAEEARAVALEAIERREDRAQPRPHRAPLEELEP
jgi:hypothetical protein